MGIVHQCLDKTGLIQYIYIMRVKFWGTRGSVPVPGSTTIRYGGNTTCIEVEDRNGNLLIIDAGTGIRALGNELMRRGKQGPIYVFLTHFHWDHIQGWPFFTPTYLPKSEFVVYGHAKSADRLREVFSYQMRTPFFPVKFTDLPCSFSFVPVDEDILKIGNLNIQTIKLCHPGGTLGLRVWEKKRAFVLMTDHEAGLKDKQPHLYTDYVKFASKADLLIHDAQFTADVLPTHKTWGHSSYQEALQLAIDAGAKRLGLFHHAPEREYNDIDRFVDHCNQILERKDKSLDVFGTMEGMVFTL
ncbi:MBL fold metallo-hydrolase [candidate division WOR-3 bacterium]|uniref:MBL fold metallo-hydrolase n=1 Tax=candidate division WOR-3 bacterium TaxID=2052148 RepID=A0A9D5KAK8_UNCW3|nr:MBL fold metallo-hydrolase [candidate division WOR-3 bacterium]MBD3365214.1 MBL fold metallo-hydrolase [candidate division WOR-3 bacterium]